MSSRPVAVSSQPRVIDEADDDGLIFEEPPPSTRGGSTHAALHPLIERLREHPNRWARIRECPGKTTAYASVKVLAKAYPDCEFVGRRYKTGSAVWARATPTKLP